MNFITAILLLHSDEVIAFELLEHLLNDYQLKDVYLNDLEGLHKHCKIIDALIFEKLPELSHHLKENGIEVKVFASEWIITLFSQTMPLSLIHVFFEKFFKIGWIAFYRVIIRMLGEM